MIKFFRKIRQQFLFENKVSKYLLYAIGEILLVVIGILIALNINNSNEDQKERTRERVYLQSLFEELKRDSISFEKTDDKLGVVENAGRSVIHFIQNPEELLSDSLQFLNDIRMMIALDQKLPEPIVWKELQSSGNLRLVQNRKLIEILYKHYHEVKACEKDYQDNAHPFILKGRYFDSKVFSIKDQDDYFDNWKKDKPSSPSVFNILLNDKEFFEISKGIVTGMIISRIQLNDARASVKKTLAALRSELDS